MAFYLYNSKFSDELCQGNMVVVIRSLVNKDKYLGKLDSQIDWGQIEEGSIKIRKNACFMNTGSEEGEQKQRLFLSCAEELKQYDLSTYKYVLFSKEVFVEDFEAYEELIDSLCFDGPQTVVVSSQPRPFVFVVEKEMVTILSEKTRSILLEQESKKVSWLTFFDRFDFSSLKKFLDKERKEQVVYPLQKDMFTVFECCPVHKIKCVIVGMDPYINDGQANGIAFSVDPGTPLPPSLQNIVKELIDDGFPKKGDFDGDLRPWVEQGVFLVNAALTVRHGESGSHMKQWRSFTEDMFHFINANCESLVVMLWGSPAMAFKKYFSDRHKILTSTHPSPFSAAKPSSSAQAFFGSKPFSNCNKTLRMRGKEQINWGTIFKKN